ncbi:MAG: phage tail protein, partial [Pseudodonghicola sp.]
IRGHWLTGRVGQRTLASVVEELCRRGGVTEIDTARLHDMVRGFSIDRIDDIRAALQPLMLRYGFDAIERDGLLLFLTRTGLGAEVLDREHLAVHGDLDGAIELTREAESELAGRVQVQFVEWGGDHEIAAEEAVLPDEETHAISVTDLSLAMTRGEARAVAERWLTEARVARDNARFALPPSCMVLGAGDIVQLPGDEGTGLYRIDRVDQAESQLIEAVRIEPAVYTPSEQIEGLPDATAFAAPVPVLPLFMDLPLITGDEVPQAPHLAVTASPWPGTVALYASAADENYALDQIIAMRSVIGLTETPMRAASAGFWDEGDALQVKLLSGALESREALAVLNGANLAAIGDGSPGNWELFQFRQADLVAADTYLLSGRLRGQSGTDGIMPGVWPVGSYFVLLNGVQPQITLTSAQRRVARHYRIGPARRGYDDPSYVHLVEAFDGIGLRPYRPCHLELTRSGAGAFTASWIRRTRLVDGSDWALEEVPLGEEVEAYRIRVLQGGALIREVQVTAPEWTYGVAAQAADGLVLPAVLEVAQLSARFGAGPAAKVALSA